MVPTMKSFLCVGRWIILYQKKIYALYACVCASVTVSNHVFAETRRNDMTDVPHFLLYCNLQSLLLSLISSEFKLCLRDYPYPKFTEVVCLVILQT